MDEGKNMLALINSRQSDRSYSDKAVEKEKLERIIEAARLSPSVCNAQPLTIQPPRKETKNENHPMR